MRLICYTHSRMFGSYNIPISVQSSYLKSYCKSKSFEFTLPVTEYCIKGCYSALLGRMASLIRLDMSEESLTVVSTSIYVFSEVCRSSSIYSVMTEANVTVIGVLEGFRGSIDQCLEELSRCSKYNDLVAIGIPHF